jgi:hypothetical protein
MEKMMPRFLTKTIAMISILVMLMLIGVACTNPQSKEEIEPLWESSSHANSESGAFTRWNDADPPEIPENCAGCHSTPGYRDLLGLDGATPGQVDRPAPVGSTIECEACHNEVSAERSDATMPSGIKLSMLDRNADCMSCHQGRASGLMVEEAISGIPLDEIDPEISAPGAHNNAAGPTLYGSEAIGGYQYEGKDYATRYPHISEFDTCIECHDSHTLAQDPEQCSACHLGVKSERDLINIRTGNIDYDGDGDINEGIAGEIETMQERLWIAINLYIFKTEGVDPLVVNRRFTNEDGDSYTTWTPRLLRAAYNYQYSLLDEGAYSHHPYYILQLLYDSIDDLGGTITGLIRPE